MSKKTSKSPSGIGVPGVLTIIFVVLKLLKVISWSWWWVFSPLWIALLIVVAAAIIILGLRILKYLLD